MPLTSDLETVVALAPLAALGADLVREARRRQGRRASQRDRRELLELLRLLMAHTGQSPRTHSGRHRDSAEPSPPAMDSAP